MLETVRNSIEEPTGFYIAAERENALLIEEDYMALYAATSIYYINIY